MLYFWFVVLLALIYFDQLLRFRIDTIVCEHQFRLYKLRDDLRESVMCEHVDPKNWVFQYLDSSIAKTISVLGIITLWHAIFLAFTYRNDPSFQRSRNNLARELEKPRNESLAKFHEQYAFEMLVFSVRRHISLEFLARAIVAGVNTQERIRSRVGKVFEYQTETPETSTLQEFST